MPTLTPSGLASNDIYSWNEDDLYLLSHLTGNVVSLDVLSNDTNSKAKTLFSIDDGNGHTNLTDYDLLNADSNGVWENTSTGNSIRIYNGKVEVNLSHSLAALGATDINSLRAGEHIHEEFVYALRIANGTLSQAKVTVDIYGQNDAASISGDASATVAEHSTTAVEGTLTVADADHGESHTQTATNATSDQGLGTYSVDADGHWSYLVNNALVQHLNADETATDTFTVTSLDGSASQLVTITIQGEGGADAPLLTTEASSGHADASIALNITVALVDLTETLGQVEIQGVPSGYTLTAGTQIDDHEWSVSASDLPGLSLVPIGGVATPGHFVLHVVATSTDGTSIASSTADLDVSVAAGTTQQSGHVIDGYIAGATVFADTNDNGILNTGEAHTTTNADGSFTLTSGSGPLVMFGGTDVSTGLAFDGVMTAPAGSTVVTPLTTLVVELAATMPGGIAAAQDAVAAAFGFTSTIDLQTYDPVPAAANGDLTALAILSAAIQVQSTITQISAVAGTDSDVITAIAHAITAANGGSVDLSLSTVVESIATQVGVEPDAIAAVTEVVSAANESIQSANNVTELAQAAQVAQGDATGALAETDFTNAGEVASLTQTYVTDLDTQVANAQVGDVDGAQVGTLGDDILTGGTGADAIDGLDGRDHIDGAGGNDFLYGGAGYDTLVGGAGNDLLDGGSGLDRANYVDATGPITVHMAVGTAAGTVTGDASVGTDTLVSIEQIQGSNSDDSYVATGYIGVRPVGSLTALNNEFEGMDGNDVITGNGYTQLSYRNAADGVTVDFALGTAYGTAPGDLANVGTDSFTGLQGVQGTPSYSGVQVVRGSDYADTLLGSNFSGALEVFQGRGGDDYIDGRGGFDRVIYGLPLDDVATAGVTINLAAGTVTSLDQVHVGTDTLRSIEAARGTNFADTYNAEGFTTSGTLQRPNFGEAGFVIIGGVQQAFNEFEGQGGDDNITGNGNTRIDYINAGDGGATPGLLAGVTIDLALGIAYGTEPGDIAKVGTDHFVGVNSIQGSYYADFLYGSDTTVVQESYDGGAGDDYIDGRGGGDVAYYNNAVGTVSGINVHLADGTVAGDFSIGNDTLRSIENVRGTNFDDTYDATGFGQAGALNIGNSGGFNSFEGLRGNDHIIGNGINTQMAFFSATAGVTVDFITGQVTGDASVGTDTFTGVRDTAGSNFNDTLIGSIGTQTFSGRGGSDTFVYSDNGGVDVFADFSHSQGDQVDLTGVTGIYSLTDVQAIAIQNGANTVLDFGGGNTLRLNNVTATNLTASDFVFTNHIVGDDNDNTLIGTPAKDFIEGLGGHDTLQGLGSDDRLDGGSGLDRAVYTDATGPVTIDLAAGTAHGTAPGDLANVGTDTLVSIEQIQGSNSDDSYVATGYTGVSPVGSLTAAYNEFEGMAGDDVITGNSNTLLSYLNATAGVTVNFTSFIAGQGSSGTATGDASVGTDTFTGVQGVRGSEFNDTFHGSNNLIGIEAFQGRGGDDFIDGGGGLDRAIYSFRTDDNLTGGIMVDMAAGTVDGDASVGHDTLRSIESVRATNSDDTYTAFGFGQAGALNIGNNGTFNEFEGFGGNDTITGNGNTRIDYVNAGDGGVTPNLLAGVTVDLLTGTAHGTEPGDIANVGNDTFTGVNSVQGSYYADALYGSNTTSTTESFDGGAGDDYIDGRGGFDLAYYNNAIGTVSGINVHLADGTVEGDFSIGTDTLRSIESVRGTNFADSYDATGYGQFGALNVGNNGTFNQFEGLGGGDVITGNGNTQLVFFSATGGVTVNFMTGTATGDASVGTDTFTGVNNVQGSNFNDTLIGAIGNQTLAGRGGADTFAYADNGGADVVTDFNHGQGDQIDLTGMTGISNLAAVQAIATQNGANTLIDFGSGNSLTLNNVTAANLTANDFIFAIVGDDDDNTLIGTSAKETILGLGGNDTLQGLGSNDRLDGGTGLDRAIYTDATGPVTINLAAGTASGAGVGNDTLVSIEQIQGSNSDDSYAATGYTGVAPVGSLTAAYNEFEGLAGDDVITGNGFTALSYVNATAGVTVDIAAGTAIGDASVGTDTFTGVNAVRGSEFADSLLGSNNPVGVVEVFYGRGGDDFFDGRSGFDRANYWFPTDDNLTGGIMVDMAAGTVDGDASVGHDTLRSIESVRATNSDDTYTAFGFGQAGALNIGNNGTFNEFEGFGGNDTITGNGNTRIDYVNAGDGGVTPNLLAGVTVDLLTGTAHGTEPGDIANVGNDTFTGVNSVQGSYYADALYGSNTTSTTESFDGGAGDDYIDGRGGFDLAYYNNAIGTVSGINVHLADGTVEGDFSIGTDTLRSIESVRGTNFADSYDATGYGQFGALNVGNNGTFNQFEGLGGNDVITGNGNTQLAFFSATAGVTVDIAAGTATGNASVGTDAFTGVAQVRGSQFADTLSGDANNNTLDGQGGNDVLNGRDGNDTLIGGAGNDTFAFDSAPMVQSTINDFTGGQDILEISAAGFDHGLVAGADPTIVTGTPGSIANSGTDGYFIFDNTTAGGGTLYWAANGGNGFDATPVAHMLGVTAVLESSVHVV